MFTREHNFGLIALTLALMAILLVHTPAFAQVANGSLSGIITDPTGAVIPDATIALKADATGVVRQTVSNGAGYFNFAAVSPGSYTVTVTMKGFVGWEQQNLVFNQAENRTLPSVVLKPGAAGESVQVVADTTAAPLETAESRQTIGTGMVQDLAIQGRNISELIKIMPGMAMNRGLNNSAWDSLTTQTNSGPIGQYSASGTQPYGSMTMTTDGANILDIGNMGSQISNINQDQTAEVTLLNSSFGAEFAKGPVTFQAISKGGTAQLHGSAYLYARNGVFNSTDAYLKANKVDKPDDSYYYPGFTIGGPVIIPGTGLNRNRDKLFFFAGYEYMKQTPQGTLYQSIVPTDAMLRGDFSAASVGNLAGDTKRVPCNSGLSGEWWYGAYCGNGGNTAMVNGMIPTSMLDPNALALVGMMPRPNQDPASHSGYNYGILDSTPVDRWEFKTKIDYNLSQSTRLSGTYTRQSESNTNQFGVWWWPSGTIPYPTTLQASTISRIITGNLTHVFSPTMTNEVVFAYSFFTFPPRFTNPDVVNPANVKGYTDHSIFGRSDILPQIPNLVSWTCNSGGPNGCFPHLYAPSMSTEFGGFGNRKSQPSIGTNFTKVFGPHTMKAGFYFDMAMQAQTTGYGSWAQGMYIFDNWTGNSTGNYLADFLIGHGQYTQTDKVPVQDVRYKTVSFYGQDQWKATRRMTLTYGVRFDHLGQWYPTGDHPGLAVWDASLYNNSSTAASYSGMTWHGRDSSIPISGFPSRWSISPRVGVAYDLFGDGDMVLRGGFGIYPWQLSANDIGGTYLVPLGIRTYSTGALNQFSDISNITPGNLGSFNGDSSFALKRGDNSVPYTENWNVIFSKQMPGRSTLELQYSGNRTRDALLTGNGDNRNFIQNINKVPLGALWGSDPVTGDPCPSNAAAGLTCDPDKWSDSQVAHFRPYQNYGKALIEVTHGSYSNYHAFMATWQKQTGRVNFILNYTFSKLLGIRDGQSNNGNGDGTTVAPFNLRDNYGPLAFDHTQIFNASYVFRLPNFVNNNAALQQVVNGWEISGITQLQSGPPLQPLTNGNLRASIPVSTRRILGTDQSAILLPYLTCDPRANLKSGQYFNPDCFAVPNQVGQNGPFVMPYMRGPAYFNSDLSIYKNFKVTERHNVQVRFSAFNFLNHPLKQFERADDTTLRFERVAGQPDNTPLSQVQYKLSNPNFTGYPAYTAGRRVFEFALKYVF